MVADVACQKPYLLTPLIAAAQTVHICKEGDTPPNLGDVFPRHLSDNDLEDCSILFPGLTKKMKYTQRRKYFNNMKNMDGLYFETDKIYTFGFWQDIFDSTKCVAILPFGTFDSVVNIFLEFCTIEFAKALPRRMGRQPPRRTQQLYLRTGILWSFFR